ncbi:MAG: replication initiator protein [Microvirus sp.]|nr:MAG: replication initiator protein [Microvirus sp.]
MACYYPIRAWQLESGDIVFKEAGKVKRSLSLPCGKCIGCRVRRSEGWATRCMHEAMMHPVSSFVTLTYDPHHYKPSLDYRDFQLFMKRLRKTKVGTPIRFFAAGEYGDSDSRPHFHALLFGAGFSNDGMVGKQIYRSAELERLWSVGFSSVGEVNRTTASYVAKYVIDKKSPSYDPDYYKRVDLKSGEIVDVTPEFGRMSNRPGIGATWFDKYWTDVYAARDGVVVDGKTLRPPRYYDERLAKLPNFVSDIKEYDRYIQSLKYDPNESSPERLAVREAVELARVDFYRKNKL